MAVKYKSSLLTSLFVIAIASTFAKVSKEEKKLRFLAENYFASGYFDGAESMYQRLDSMSPNNLEYQYKLAVCQTRTYQHKEDAEKTLESILKSGITKSGKFKINLSELHYYVAKSHHLNNHFDAAMESYKKCIELDMADYELIDDAKISIQHCKNAKEIYGNPIDIEIKNLGKPINSRYDEHSALVTADEEYLFFTTKRPGNVGDKLDIHGDPDPNGMYFEDIYVSRNDGGIWRKPYNITDTINTIAHEATTGLSADGQKMFLYISAFGKFGDVYESDKVGEHWTQPYLLPKPINTNTFMEAHVSLSGTGNEIYFTSDRPGGFGGRDIYVCKKEEDGSWSEPINLGPDVNTEYNEVGPYMHVDGKTLFFSSKGHKSMGGYDIFKTAFNGESWDKPKNIGYPLNTSGDDVYFVLSADGKKGYYTSRRDGGFGGADIYTVEVNYEFGEPVVVVLKGIVNELGQAVDAVIIVTDIDKDLVIGEYNSNAMSGDYLLALPPGAKYDVHFLSQDGTLDKHVEVNLKDVEEYVKIEHDVEMKEDFEKEQKVGKVEVDPETGEIKKSSTKSFNKIQDVLKNNPDLKLEVAMFADTTNSNKVNLASSLGGSLKQRLLEKGADTNRVVPKIVSTANPLLDQEIQVKVLHGNVADKIVVKDNKVFVKEGDIVEELISGGSAKNKEVDKISEEVDKEHEEDIKEKAIEQVTEEHHPIPLKEEETVEEPEQEQESTDKVEVPKDDLSKGYKVQIAAFSRTIPISSPFFKSTQDIEVREWDDGLTRYTVGHFDSFEDANEHRKELLHKFYDAFIVHH